MLKDHRFRTSKLAGGGERGQTLVEYALILLFVSTALVFTLGGLTADIRKFTNERDDEFCKRLVKDAGVALIPLSAFFETGEPSHLVRFAFCKKRDLLEQALDRLENHFQTRTS